MLAGVYRPKRFRERYKLDTLNGSVMFPEGFRSFALCGSLYLRLSCRSFLLLTTLATPAVAQVGPPPGTDLLRPLSAQAAAESLAVIRRLDSTLRRNSRDANIWYRRGMIAWALAYRARLSPKIPGLDWTLLGRMADTSLRLANIHGSGDPRIVLATGQYFLGTGLITMRVQAYPMFPRALDAARKAGDSLLLAETALEVGRLAWRQYDAVADRVLVANVDDVVRSLESAPEHSDRCSRRNWVCRLRAIGKPTQSSGESHYIRAEELFREAYAAAPDDPRTLQQLGMLLSEKSRWTELAALAQDRVRRRPDDAHAWMALGLAHQRLGHRIAAEAAFDTALARLDPVERRHIERMERLLAVQDTLSVGRLDETEQAQQRDLYWLVNDPLWSHPGNEARSEFYARITYADLRWTVPELGVRGIDSDRGMIHVRYGPPDLSVSLAPQPLEGDIGEPNTSSGFNMPARLGQQGAAAINRQTNVTTLWAYDVGWLFVFQGAPTYGTARIPVEDSGVVDSLMRVTPSLWKSATDITFADMPGQLARFRAPGDSVDVITVVDPPFAELREVTSRNTPIVAHYWLISSVPGAGGRDSAVLLRPEAPSWISRVAPDTYAVRVEVTAEGATLAGRLGAFIPADNDPRSGFALRGFGMSDVLLGSGAVGTTTPKRWDELRLRPVGGVIAHGSMLNLVWENYDFGNRDGGAEYGITLTLKREYAATLNRIRARIVSSFAAIAGQDRTADRVVYRFDRRVPYAAIIVDQLGLAMDETPAGRYSLIVDVTDRTSGRTVSRTVEFVIRE